YSLLLTTLGRKDESLAEMEKAKDLSPLNSTVLANYFAVRYYRGENDELIHVAEQIRNLDDDNYKIVPMLSSVYLRKANYAKVIETVNEFLNRHNDRTYEDLLRSNLAVAYSRNGELEKSDQELRRLDEIAKHDTETAYRLAVAYTDLGRNDE